MPVITAGGYLIDALIEAGPTVPGAMGELPLSWQDVWAYAQATGAVSEPWECRALRDMSRAFLAAREAGKEPLAIAPVDQD